MNIGQNFNPFRLFVGAFIPNALMRYTKISQGAKLCYARLAQFAGQNGEAFPNRETLAFELGVSLSQVKRYIKELKTHGFIEVIEPKGKDKFKHLNNKYCFKWHEIFECNEPSEWVTCEPSGRVIYEPSGRVVCELEKPSQNKTAKEIPEPEENHYKENHYKENHNNIVQNFENLWKLYPLKRGKGSISETKKKEIYLVGFEKMKLAIERYIKDTELRREVFPEMNYKNGSTFFNSGYLDFIDDDFEYYKPDIKPKQNKKPTLATNYEQREYDDEHFKKLYERKVEIK